jgi:alpha-amylase/alpha-mannosidase (GH57 family)
MTTIAILWHMHQPYYQDLATGEHILPWVRLHALKDYYGMVALLREFPDVRMTFNLVPSLLVQLEAFAEDRANDHSLDLSLKPAEALDEADVEFVIENFFHAHPQHMIGAHPRYAELLALRGGSLPTPADRRAAAARFSRDDLRDLQVWHKLAWVDPLYQDGDRRVRQLLAKGRDYSEDDKALLRRVELEILNKVIPEYREAADRLQIEISASPFYHPILPLLCDTDIYLRTHPHSRMPRRRFARPGDAAEQLARAAACHERLFGRRPVGLWPSEGSVSDAVVPLVAAAGFRWMATDELILARTLGMNFSRDDRGHVEQPEQLYEPYAVSVGGATVSCLFRDHTLSDLIGFTYAGWAAEAAADDFVSRLVEAGRRYRDRTGGEEACIPIILDGENAWEHFPGGGRPFLRALYRRLSGHAELRTLTMAEACAAPARMLTGIFPGSWIDANFYIWIGHADDQKGWSQLAEARDALETSSAGPAALAEAGEEILIAEGSDWFWWYGDDHTSAHDLEFDDLFRRHLRNAYRRLQKPVPGELYVSNISAGAPAPDLTTPSAQVSPTIDGEETSYFEWLGAGTVEVRDVPGAMHQTDRPPSPVRSIRFGCDRQRLFVRVAGAGRVADLLAGGQDISINFLVPDEVRFTVRHRQGQVTGSLWDRRPSADWVERGPAGAVLAAGTVLELALPLAALGVAAGGSVSFFVAVSEADGVERGRYPAHRPIELVVPDAQFEARNWRA